MRRRRQMGEEKNRKALIKAKPNVPQQIQTTELKRKRTEHDEVSRETDTTANNDLRLNKGNLRREGAMEIQRSKTRT